MGFIPKDARWYLADLVLEHRIDGQGQNVVHVNTHLVEAGSPDEAYEKALALGRGGEHEYENVDGRQVRVVFRGLRELNVIHEPLEDGAEIIYTEDVGVPEEQLREWVRPRERLGVFAPIEAKHGPDYMPESVMQMLEAAGFSREDVKGGAEPDAAADGGRGPGSS
jgi:hypothetical protein